MQRSTLVLALLLVPGIASGYEWTDVEVIDGPVESISASQGNPVVSDGDRWYVTYVKDGDVWIRVREGETWQAPMQMETDPSVAVSPQLGTSQELVVLAWQDDRSGHAEIYTRTLEDGVWSLEECRTCDGVESRAPAMSHNQYDDEVFLVWEEGPAGAATITRASREVSGWTAAVPVSTVPGGETPSVTGFYAPVVVWIDHRDGSPVLYARMGSDDEQPVENPYSGEVRNPSVHYEYCCSDVGEGDVQVVAEIEEEGGSIVATVLLGRPDPRLAQAGVLGTGVSIDGWQFEGDPGCGSFGEWEPRFGTVSSVMEDDRYRITFAHPSGSDDFVLTEAGLTHAALGGIEGRPMGEMFATWVEEVEGVPTLVGRRGQEVGGSSFTLEAPPDFVLVAPAGAPTNAFRLVDGYSGDPWTWPEDVGVLLSEALGDALNLEIGTSYLYLEDAVDGDGRVEVSIPGGGCSQAGTAYFFCRWGPIEGAPEFLGAKSPDVDGDCIVTAADLAYVEAQLGTDDYCADLDGSGVVDGADVGIVQATFNDVCAFVDVPGDAQAPRPMLRVDRNPFRTGTTLRLALPEGAERIEVYDVTGRRVRVLADALEVGGHVIGFDGRDDTGHALAPGAYFVTVVTASRTLHERLTLLR